MGGSSQLSRNTAGQVVLKPVDRPVRQADCNLTRCCSEDRVQFSGFQRTEQREPELDLHFVMHQEPAESRCSLGGKPFSLASPFSGG